MKARSLQTLALLAGLLPSSGAWAISTIVGTPVIYSMDVINPWSMGSLASVSLTVQNLTSNGEEGRVHLAISTDAFASCWTTLPNAVNADVRHYAANGGGLGSVVSPLLGSNDNNIPNGGYRAFSIAGPIQQTLVFTVKLPPSLVPGASYRIHLATNDYYLGVGDASADSSYCFAFTASNTTHTVTPTISSTPMATATPTVTPTVVSNLGLSKSVVGANVVQQAQLLSYRLSWSHQAMGPSTAAWMEIVDTLPAVFNYISATVESGQAPNYSGVTSGVLTLRWTGSPATSAGDSGSVLVHGWIMGSLGTVFHNTAMIQNDGPYQPTYGGPATAWIATATPTLSATRTPTVGAATGTSTVTDTPTRSATPTATPSMTLTFCAGCTSTPSATNSATVSMTGTRSATQTPTSTRTVTPTVTPTRTFCAGCTSTFTPTVTPTATPSATLTFCAGCTSTFTPTVTLTGTSGVPVSGTLTATPTVTPTPSPSFTPTVTTTPMGVEPNGCVYSGFWDGYAVSSNTCGCWLQTVPGASWVGKRPGAASLATGDVFSVLRTLYLPASVDLGAVRVRLQYTADDHMEIRVNGTVINTCINPGGASPCAMVNDVLVPGGILQLGDNSIEFRVTDEWVGYHALSYSICWDHSGLATPTPSETATPALSHTVSQTFSPTATRSVTSGGSMTGTRSATETPTSTRTVTSTATLTATPSVTLTYCGGCTSTFTPTLSPTASATLTGTSGGSVTGTRSATETPTRTVTRTASPSETRSPTPSSTSTACGGCTSTFTPTLSPTASATLTGTSGGSVTGTRSATETPTRTATRTASPSETRSPTVSLTPTSCGLCPATFTFTPTVTRTPTTPPSGGMGSPTPTRTLVTPGGGSTYPYPNPASGSVNIAIQSPGPGRAIIEILNSRGRLVTRVVQQLNGGLGSVPVSLRGFARGVYYYHVRLELDDGRILRLAPKRFVVKRS